MEHPFFPTTTTRAEALRLLTIADKLLTSRDLMGSKSFASRARESDPTLLPADQILAVVDTLLSGDRRIGNNQQDWYSILQLSPSQGWDLELVASQYRRLALLLNPQKNKYSFADQAFRLVMEAWTVLSNPSRKSLYEKDLAFGIQSQQQSDLFHPGSGPTLQRNLHSFGSNSAGSVNRPSHAQSHPLAHGGGSSSSGASHFPQVQVHAQPQVEPVADESVPGQASKPPPQNFPRFASGINIAFGSGSGSTQEPVNEMPHENYPDFPAYMPSASESNLNMHANENVQDESVDEQEADEMDKEEAEERTDIPNNDGGSTFWTACPYCYHMYEYPGVYADCTLRCQNCRRAFHAVVIQSPPPILDGQEGYFCCWGFLPLGVSMENLEKNRGAASSWSPFSPMFTCPQMVKGDIVSPQNKNGGLKTSAPRVYVEDDEVFIELSTSSESDGDWQDDRQKKKKMKNVRGKSASETPNKAKNLGSKKALVHKAENVNAQDGVVSPQGSGLPNKLVGECSKKAAAFNARKQPGRVAENFGDLDLNVEVSNEVEEPVPSMNQGNGSGRGEDDNIEGIGFFEGLDEFLSSLPILNVVGDDKVVKAA